MARTTAIAITSQAMTKKGKTRTIGMTKAEIQERGRALQHTFRVAGIPQYTRWFAEVDPLMMRAAGRPTRIRRILNGEGTTADAALIEKCEDLVKRHIRQTA